MAVGKLEIFVGWSANLPSFLLMVLHKCVISIGVSIFRSNNSAVCSTVSRITATQTVSGHTAATRTFAHSPSMPAFVTGSDDFRARFWYKKSQ